MTTTITLQAADRLISDCVMAILVPDIAIEEAGYIRTFTVDKSGHAKHAYHALAQMAYFQFQDGELEITELDSPLSITCGTETEEMNGGLLLYRDGEGAFQVLASGKESRKKLLETAYRYCTRWVRLDI